MRQRVGDWPRALRAVIDRHRAGPVEIGRCDCASLVADAVRAVTGRPPADNLLTFSTHRGALRVLRNRGFTSALDAVDSLFERVPVNELQRGDLAWGPVIGDGPLSVPAIVDGASVVTMSHAGLLVLPRFEMTTGWAV